MPETANIAEMANKVASDIFDAFLWIQVGPTDENWECVYQRRHGTSTHPSDLVMTYCHPYLHEQVYILFDLKSYAASSINSSSLSGAIRSLCRATECARVSESFSDLYIDTPKAKTAAWQYFTHNINSSDWEGDRQEFKLLQKLLKTHEPSDDELVDLFVRHPYTFDFKQLPKSLRDRLGNEVYSGELDLLLRILKERPEFIERLRKTYLAHALKNGESLVPAISQIQDPIVKTICLCELLHDEKSYPVIEETYQAYIGQSDQFELTDLLLQQGKDFQEFLGQILSKNPPSFGMRLVRMLIRDEESSLSDKYESIADPLLAKVLLPHCPPCCDKIGGGKLIRDNWLERMRVNVSDNFFYYLIRIAYDGGTIRFSDIPTYLEDWGLEQTEVFPSDDLLRRLKHNDRLSADLLEQALTLLLEHQEKERFEQLVSKVISYQVRLAEKAWSSERNRLLMDHEWLEHERIGQELEILRECDKVKEINQQEKPVWDRDSEDDLFVSFEPELIEEEEVEEQSPVLNPNDLPLEDDIEKTEGYLPPALRNGRMETVIRTLIENPTDTQSLALVRETIELLREADKGEHQEKEVARPKQLLLPMSTCIRHYRNELHRHYFEHLQEWDDGTTDKLIEDAWFDVERKVHELLEELELPAYRKRLVLYHMKQYPSRPELEELFRKHLKIEEAQELDRYLTKCSDEVLPGLLTKSLQALTQGPLRDGSNLDQLLRNVYPEYIKPWTRSIYRILGKHRDLSPVYVKGFTLALRILREPHAGKVPVLLSKIEKDDYVGHRVRKFVKKQRQLFSRKNLKRGRHLPAQRRIRRTIEALAEMTKKSFGDRLEEAGWRHASTL